LGCVLRSVQRNAPGNDLPDSLVDPDLGSV
jgi:hypothetical protein